MLGGTRVPLFCGRFSCFLFCFVFLVVDGFLFGCVRWVGVFVRVYLICFLSDCCTDWILSRFESVYTYIYLSLSVFTFIYQSLSIFTFIYQYLSICTSTYPSLSIFTSIYPSLSIFTPFHLHLHLPISVYIHIYLSIYIHTHTHTKTYLCMTDHINALCALHTYFHHEHPYT